MKHNSRHLLHQNISNLTRGDAFEYYLPKVIQLKSARIVNRIVPLEDITEPFTLHSLPPESQLKEWKQQMVNGPTATCYIEKSGTFSMSICM